VKLAYQPEDETELDKSPDAFRTISEVADDLDVPQHVLRFWETRFAQIKPLKRGGGRRYYRPDDVGLLKGIRRLLYGEGYTIKGVQRILKERGARHVVNIGLGAPVEPAAIASEAGPSQIAQRVASGPSALPRPAPTPANDPVILRRLTDILAELKDARAVLDRALVAGQAG
jgi:DNA-binding transcriptional MerR regulator